MMTGSKWSQEKINYREKYNIIRFTVALYYFSNTHDIGRRMKIKKLYLKIFTPLHTRRESNDQM